MCGGGGGGEGCMFRGKGKSGKGEVVFEENDTMTA